MFPHALPSAVRADLFIDSASIGKEFLPLTVLRVHREVGLPLQDAVHQLGAVPVRFIVRVIGGYSDNRRTCEEREQAAFRRERSSD